MCSYTAPTMSSPSTKLFIWILTLSQIILYLEKVASKLEDTDQIVCLADGGIGSTRGINIIKLGIVTLSRMLQWLMSHGNTHSRGEALAYRKNLERDEAHLWKAVLPAGGYGWRTKIWSI